MTRRPPALPRQRTRCSIRCLGLILLGLCGPAVTVSSAEQAWRRAYVPAGSPDDWPAGDWSAVPWSELEPFLDATSGGDDPAAAATPVIEQVVYRGALNDSGFLEGTFEAQVRRPDQAAEFLEFSGVGIAVSQLNWSEAEAEWGTAPDDRILLRVDRPAGVLTGRWSALGRLTLDRRKFDLALLPAGATRLELSVPRELTLRCSGGLLLDAADAGNGRRLWTVELGQRCRCTCIVEPESTPAPPLLHCERTLVYAVRSEVCRLQADFTVHAQGSVPGELVFRVPAQLQDLAVSYATTTQLPSQSRMEGDTAVLSVPLPELPPGRIGTIRIAGNVDVQEDRDWTLPVVNLQDAVLLSGERRIHIDRPLMLNSASVDGLRATGLSGDVSGIDWYYEDLSPDASIRVRIGRPPVQMDARIVTHLQAAAGTIDFRSAVELKCYSGSGFHARFAIPADWIVREVTAAPQNAASAIAAWAVAESGAGQHLDVEFRQAFAPLSSRRILIAGRSLDRSRVTVPLFPFPRLESPQTTELFLAVSAADDMLPAPDPESAWRAGVDPPGGLPWDELRKLVQRDGDAEPAAWFAIEETAPPPAAPVTMPARESEQPPREAESPIDGDAAETEPEPDRPLQLRMRLQTAFSSDEKWLLHVARCGLSRSARGESLHVSLPPSARIDSIMVDGERHDATAAAGGVALADLDDDSREIEVRYRTPAELADSLHARLPVPLPVWNRPVRGFEWHIELPRRLQLAGCDVPQSICVPEPDPGWQERLFGPLARRDGSRFAPLREAPWAALLPSENSAPPRTESDRAVAVHAPSAPQSARLLLIDAGRIRPLSWIVLVGSLIGACLLRAATPSNRGAMCAAVAAAAAALWFDPAYAPLAGAAFRGILLACLLPRNWIRPRGPVATNNPSESRLSRSALVQALIMFALLGIARRAPLTAQERNTPEPPPHSVEAAITPPEAAPDVLIPYQDDRFGPVAYLRSDRRSLFDDWRRSRMQAPDYLIRRASYVVLPESPGLLRAEYEVVPLRSGSPVTVRLPLSHIDFRPEAPCQVNGKPALVRPNATATAWLVEISPSSADDSAEPARSPATITLFLKPRSATDLHLGIPVVLDSRFEVPGVFQVAPSTSAWGAVSIDPSGAVHGELGGAPLLSLKSDSGSVSGEAQRPATLPADAVSLVELHPLRARVRTQLVPAASDGSGPLHGATAQNLTLWLPGRAEVREVAAPDLVSYSAWCPSEDQTLLELEFGSPLEAGRRILLDFMFPLEESGQSVVVPQMALVGPSALKSHRIGLRAMRGFELSSAAPPDAVQQLPAELFGGPGDLAWPAPDVAYLAQSPVPLTMRLAPVEPVRSVACEQSIVVRERHADWSASAAIDVRGAPAYSHRLHVGADARIESVSLLQDGADRLLNWLRDGDDLLLSVQSETVGRQELRISGRLPFRPDSTISVPPLSFDQAEVTAAELVAENSASEPIEVLDADGGLLDRLPPAGPVQSASSLRRLSMLGESRPDSLRRIERPQPDPILSILSLSGSANQWEITQSFVAAELPVPLSVSLPRSWAESIELEPGIVSTQVDDADADAETIQLELRPASGMSWNRLHLRFPLTIPQDRQSPLPVVRPAGLTETVRWLMLPNAAPFDVETRDAAPVASADVPAAVAESAGARGAETRFFRLASSNPLLLVHRPAGKPLEIPLAETTIWSTGPDRIAGRSRWFVVALQPQFSLDIRLPASVRLNGVFWDGDEHAPRESEPSKARIHPKSMPVGSLHCLELEWEGRLQRERWLKAVLERPVPVEVLPAEDLLVLIPGSEQVLWGTEATASLTPGEYGLARLEALLSAATSITGQSTAGGGSSFLRQDVAATVEDLSGRPLTSDEARLIAEARRLGLDVSPPSGDEPRLRAAPEPRTTYSAGIATAAWREPHSLLLRPSTNSAQVRSWRIGRLWGLAGASIVLAGVAAAILLRGRRKQRTSSRSSIPDSYVGVIVAGFIWWLWFPLSAGGLLLALLGGALQCSAWFRRNARTSAAVAGT